MSPSQTEPQEDDGIITIEDREYEKIAHEFSSNRIFPNMEENGIEPYTFPEITCYDDVVLYGKQLFYAVYRRRQTAPYTVCYNEENDCWIYSCKMIHANGDFMDTDDRFRVFLSGSGELLGIYPPLPKDYVVQDIAWDTSNAFTFNYDDFSDYTGSTVYNEKLQKITCAEDVVERALYLYDKWDYPNNNNPYSICYDEKNDCWLYNDWVSAAEYCATLTMIIHSDGEILLVHFFYNIIR